MKKTALLIIIMCAAIAAAAQGRWEGKLSMGPMKLPLVLNIECDSQGNPATVTLDSPSQGAVGIPAEATLTGDELQVTIAAIGASFKGKITDDNTIAGTFSQSTFNLPLTFARKQEAAIKEAEPQGFNEREVTFGHDGVTLAGTLTMPSDNAAAHTAVVLVSGSGTQDRDETILGHKPFKHIAHHLARNGIAVLRYDDRGAGKSSPLRGNETTLDFAADANAALSFLSTQPGVNALKVGYIGHSEGGQIAIINAATTPGAAFIITLAAPAVKGSELMLKQNLDILDLQGITCTSGQVAELTKVFDDIVAIQDTTALRQALREDLANTSLQHYTPAQLEQTVATMTSPWYIASIRFNPAPYLSRVRCPMLALNGEWDCQVNAEQNLAAITAAIPGAKCVKIARHNHLFQECDTRERSLDYYSQGEISQTTLDLILNFLSSL